MALLHKVRSELTAEHTEISCTVSTQYALVYVKVNSRFNRGWVSHCAIMLAVFHYKVNNALLIRSQYLLLFLDGIVIYSPGKI